jgi:hypothetical protein
MDESLKRNRVSNIRLDGMTRDEQYEMTRRIMDAKQELAPDARLTIVEGSHKQFLPKKAQQIEVSDE